MKQIALVFIFIFYQIYGFGQFLEPKIFSTGGNSFFNSNLHIDYTIGETFTETEFNNEYYINSGFQQPIQPEVVKIGEFFVNPNPVMDILYVKGAIKGIDVEVICSDLSGKIYYKSTFNYLSDAFKIDVSSFPLGIFLLELHQNNLHNTYKIVKIN